MKVSSHIKTVLRHTLGSASLGVVLCMMTSFVVYGQSDSPCNQGRDPEHDPRNPWAICLPYIGRMDDFQGPCSIHNGGGQFGNQLAAVGDVDNSGTVDFLVGHALCDSTLSLRAEELLLYKGVNGGLPNSGSGQRIGPTERNSITTFVAAGDWDDDHHIDIAVRMEIVDDTSFGGGGQYDVASLVIFWGNNAGAFSITDTTRLWGGADGWGGPTSSVAVDIDSDDVDDLITFDSWGQGLTKGQVVSVPKLLIFHGHHNARWGRNGLSRGFDWDMWNSPGGSLKALDQDADGALDVAFHNNDGNVATLSALYGKPGGGFPDTTDVQTIEIAKKAGTGFSLFSDVTGDHVPDLLCGSGIADVVKVYVGFKGQRLLEQFGSGNDSEQVGSEKWWGKPWAKIWLPRKINPNWFGNDDQLFDLGDVNQDGIADIFAFSWPYIVEYNGGAKLDSMVDALINISPGTEIGILKRVGNIDGSGRDIIALTTGNEIRFYAPTKDIPSNGVSRRLPPGTGKAAVEDQAVVGDGHAVVLTAIPNPSRDEIRFSWNGPSLHGSATIALYDVSGREVSRCDVHVEDGNARCIIQGLAVGTYLAQFRCDDHSTSTTVVVQ